MVVQWVALGVIPANALVSVLTDDAVPIGRMDIVVLQDVPVLVRHNVIRAGHVLLERRPSAEGV
jgi:hypothetical protein